MIFSGGTERVLLYEMGKKKSYGLWIIKWNEDFEVCSGNFIIWANQKKLLKINKLSKPTLKFVY